MKINIYVTPIETPGDVFETLVDVLHDEGRDFCFYKSNLDSYSFTAYDFLVLPFQGTADHLEEMVGVVPVITTLQGTLPAGARQAIPFVFDTRPFDQLNEAGWAHFPDSLFMPQCVVLEWNKQSYFIALSLDSISLIFFEEALNRLKGRILSKRTGNVSGQATIPVPLQEILSQNRDTAIAKIASARQQIIGAEVEKVVLAMKISFRLSNFPLWSSVLRKMDTHKHAHRFIYKRNGAAFFGASPELLFAYQDGKLFSEALAGTIERGMAAEDDVARAKALTESRKDSLEQQFVVKHIIDSLRKYSEEIEYDLHPRIRQTRKLFHLRTRILARNIKKEQLPGIFQEIFPTPAVCGTPKAKAKQIISDTEGYERGLYSGAFGWSNAGEGIMYFVPLRCALYHDSTLAVFAGGGIVADSDPEAEYEEAASKARSVISMVIDED